MIPLTLTPDPKPSQPDRHALLLPCGTKVGVGKTRHHAECWRDGWNARLDEHSRRSGPAEHHTGHSHWLRGWERANEHLREQARSQRRAA